MAIGRKRSFSEGLARLKFDGRYGTFCTEDRVLENNNWATVQENIELSEFAAIFDLEALQVGWIAYPKGEAPNAVWFPAGVDTGAAPSKDHKEGLKLIVKLDGVVRELMSTSLGLWIGMNSLHDDFVAQKGKHVGKVPIVELTGVEEVKHSAGASFQPTFTIADWIFRPADLPVDLATRQQSASPKKKIPPPRNDLDDEIVF